MQYVKICKNTEKTIRKTNDDKIIADWRKLQVSDHFYYMCTKYFADGDVHKYFNPYDSPYDSYINFMNVLDSLHSRCSEQKDGGKLCSVNKQDAKNFIRGVKSQGKNPPDLLPADQVI